MYVYLKYIGSYAEITSKRDWTISLFWETIGYHNFISDYYGARHHSIYLFKEGPTLQWMIHAGLISVKFWATRKVHEVGIPLPGKKARLKRKAERDMDDIARAKKYLLPKLRTSGLGNE